MSQKFCLNSNMKGQYHDNINNKSLLLLRAQECSESIKVAPQVPVEHFYLQSEANHSIYW